jgi:hypothetical protein
MMKAQILAYGLTWKYRAEMSCEGAPRLKNKFNTLETKLPKYLNSLIPGNYRFSNSEAQATVHG